MERCLRGYGERFRKQLASGRCGACRYRRRGYIRLGDANLLLEVGVRNRGQGVARLDSVALIVGELCDKPRHFGVEDRAHAGFVAVMSTAGMGRRYRGSVWCGMRWAVTL